MDNKTFWNSRYINDPWIGSGPGSRGIAQHYKGYLIKNFIDSMDISSIVDIGCGDLCWLKTDFLGFNQGIGVTYTGLDIADIVVNKNRVDFPNLEFAVYDLENTAVPVAADLIVCMDVLIHQTRKEQFDACLKYLLEGITKYALISYKNPDQSKTPVIPDIAGFNEPVENDFQTYLAEQRKKRKVQPGLTNNFGALESCPLIKKLGLRCEHVGDYRYQSVYLITHLSSV